MSAEKASASKARKAASQTQVKVTPAKGRPMLTWVGKRPLSRVTPFPAQHIETFDPTGELATRKAQGAWADWPEKYPRGGAALPR